MSKSKALIVPDEAVIGKILLIREKKVMIDKDIAELYNVTTKRLNEQVKRNSKRFPEDFMFQLTEHEKEEVVANCDHLNSYLFKTGLILLCNCWLNALNQNVKDRKPLYPQ